MRFLSSKVVESLSGYSRTSLWRKSRDPNDDFPAPRILGDNKIAWLEADIQAWMESRPLRYGSTHTNELGERLDGQEADTK